MIILFELIQIAIGKRKNLSTKSPIVNWKELFALAQRQGVASIVLDGINRCFEQGYRLDLDFQTKMDWIGVATQIETVFRQHVKVIGSLSEKLEEEGFKMMVLKGYGLSQNYPVPKQRPMGDLDIWCFGREKEVDELLETKGFKIDRAHHHHTVFCFNQILVENHFDFINTHSRLSNKRVERRLKELASKNNYCKDGVYYPSADFNALFLLRHCASHFVSTELTIRQALDWGLFMEKHHQEINWESYISYIKQEGMYRFYNLLGLFCMTNLCFDASIFHGLYSDELIERFTNDIISPEFGDHEDGTLIKSLVVKPKRWWHNRWKSKLCYPDSLMSSFINGLWAKILKPSHFIQ